MTSRGPEPRGGASGIVGLEPRADSGSPPPPRGIAGAAGVIIWKSYSKGWIFWAGKNPSAHLAMLAASVPIIAFLLGLVGSTS